MKLAWTIACVLAVPVAACAVEDDKGEESALPEDGKDDSFRRPTDHGAIGFAQPAASALTDLEQFHAWTFELSGSAQVKLTTSYAVLGQRRTDTVLYLYKEGPSGWGSYVARNDDYAQTTYSQLARTLGPGRYRALVKGYATTTRGKFKLTAECAGEGCAPAASACLFGDTYNDALSAPGLSPINTNVWTAAILPNLTADDQARVVAAVRQSAHTDVTTAAQAFERVDGGEINVTWLVEAAARRTFVAFEYGAGDNSYGAIFAGGTAEIAAAIHDGDLSACTAQAEVCLLPEDDVALRTDVAFTHAPVRVVRSPSDVNAAEAAQVLAALRATYGAEITDLATGLSRADDDQVNLRPIVHRATGTALTVVEFGAGDTSVGAVYFGATLERAATIADLFISDCAFFAAR